MYLIPPGKILLLLIAGLLVISPVHAVDLGRLFTSAEERKELDRLRQARPKPQEIAVKEPVPVTEQGAETIVPETTLTLRGIVYRSDGKNTAWIDSDTLRAGDENPLYIEVNDTPIKPDVAPAGSRVIKSRNGVVIIGGGPVP